MAINFPNNPSNGDAHAGFIYNSTKSVWEATAASVPMSDTPPANPAQGDLWFDSSVAKTYIYYNDGSSSQWVQLNPSGGSDGADGADATTGGESPVILTEPPTTTQELNNDGTTSTVTMTAQDPEGFDITYGIAYKTSGNTRPTQLSADTTINQSTGVYTFTPSTTQANAGSFRARLSASDGANTTTRLVDFNLTFNPTITYIMYGGGGGGGSHFAGGGGAGGLIDQTSSTTTLTIGTTYAITVGSGGSGGTYSGASGGIRGDSGGDTTFLGQTAIGGGGGGSRRGSSGQDALSGGSGGGGGNEYTSTAGAAGTPGQGYAGGDGYDSSASSAGGGGGGAAGAGGDASASTGGTGGAGSSISITGSAITYCQGGSGATQNTDGVGGGSSDMDGAYGGGGAGASSGGTGGDGSVGAVIISSTHAYASATGSPTLTMNGSLYVYTFTSNGSITF